MIFFESFTVLTTLFRFPNFRQKCSSRISYTPTVYTE